MSEDQEQEQEQETQIQWYVQHDGDVLGPFTSSAVRRSLLLDQVSLSDAISTDSKSWQPLFSVPEVVPPQLRRGGWRGGMEEAANGAPVQNTNWLKLGVEKTPFFTLALSIMLVGVAIGFGLYKGGLPEPPQPECKAPPQPNVNWRNCSLDGIQAPLADMSRADMYSALLRRAKLSGAILNGGNLEYADLSGADISYAQLNGARMKGANLQNADLTNTDLTGADLSFSTLRGATPGGVILKGAKLDNAIWFDGSKCLPGSVSGCAKSVQ